MKKNNVTIHILLMRKIPTKLIVLLLNTIILIRSHEKSNLFLNLNPYTITHAFKLTSSKKPPITVHLSSLFKFLHFT